MECNRYEEWLAGGGAPSEGVEAHVESCVACKEAREADALLRRAVPVTEPSPLQDAALVAEVRAIASVRRWRSVTRGVVAGVAALVIVTCIGSLVREMWPQRTLTSYTLPPTPPAPPPFWPPANVSPRTVVVPPAWEESVVATDSLAGAVKLELYSDARMHFDAKEATLADFEKQRLPAWPPDVPVRVQSAGASYADLSRLLVDLRRAGASVIDFEVPPCTAQTRATSLGWLGFAYLLLHVERTAQGPRCHVVAWQWHEELKEDRKWNSGVLPRWCPSVRVYLDVRDEDLPLDFLKGILADLSTQQIGRARLVRSRPPSPLRVYAADGNPRWEWRYLKGVLERDSSLRVETHLDSADPSCPQAVGLEGRAIEASPYDVIVLGDMAVSKALAGSLRKWVEAGGGLILLAGREHMPEGLRGTALQEVLPCVLGDAPLAWETFSKPTPIDFTPSGRHLFEGPDSPIEQGKDVWWNGQGCYGRVPLRLAASAQMIASFGANLDKVAFATRKVGKGMIFLSAIDETWRWRSGNPAPYEAFWKTVVRLVARTREARRVCLVQGAAPSFCLEQALKVIEGCGGETAIRLSVTKEAPSSPPPQEVVFLDGVLPPASYRNFVMGGGTLVIAPTEEFVKDRERLVGLCNLQTKAGATKIRPDMINLSTLAVNEAGVGDYEVYGRVVDTTGAMLYERPLGQGRILVFGQRLDPAATPFAASPAFPPLIEELVKGGGK